MGRTSYPVYCGTGEKDFALRILRMRFSFLLLFFLFFTALHAAALFPLSAHAQASDVELHAGWGDAGDKPTAQRAEGETALLTVRATGLSGATTLKVYIEADRPMDTTFTNWVILTAAASSAQVRVTATEDGLPEPREEVEFQASVPDNPAVAARTARLEIPRHGYKAGLRASPETARLETTVTVTATLNGPAPAPASAYIEIRPEGGNPMRRVLVIPEGATAGRISFVPDVAGEHWISASTGSLRFSSGESGDQLVAPFDLDSVVVQVLKNIRLGLTLSSNVLEEGEEAPILTVAAWNLLPNEALEVSLTVTPTLDVRLFSSQFRLTADKPTKAVRVRALKDNMAEPRETVRIDATAFSGGSQWRDTGTVEIPRNDYEARLRVRPEAARLGTAVTVEIALNGPPPGEEAAGIVIIESGGREIRPRESLFIPADRNIAQFFFTPEIAGEHRISLWGRGQLNFRSVEDGDQPVVPSSPHSAVLQVVGNFRLGATLSRTVLAEGESATLTVTAWDLLPGEAPEVSLTATPTLDVGLFPSQLRLTADKPEQNVKVTAVKDNMAEPRETVRIDARAFFEGVIQRSTATAVIPRNDYKATLRVRPEAVRPGTAVAVEIELNGPPPGEEAAGIVIIESGGREVRSRESLFIPADRNIAQFFFTPEIVGEHRVSLWGRGQLDFRSVEDGDQPVVPSSPRAAVLRVLGNFRLGTTLSRTVLAEGESTTLTVTAWGLLPNETLQASLSADPDFEVELSSMQLEFTGRTLRRHVRVTALADDMPELGETVRINATASFRGVVRRSTATVVIPRNGYEAELEVTPAETIVGASPELRVTLNADAPSAVAAVVHVTPALSPGQSAPERLRVSIARNQSSGSVSLPPMPQAADYVFELAEASFVEPGVGADQSALRGAGSSATLRVFNPQMNLSLEPKQANMQGRGRVYANEGDTLTLTVRIEDLPGDRAVEVNLGAGVYRPDVRLSPSMVRLSAVTPTALVTVELLEDEAAEDTHGVRLWGSADVDGVLLEAHTKLAELRNGYTAKLRVRPATARLGTRVAVEAELNGPKPVSGIYHTRVDICIELNGRRERLSQYARIPKRGLIGRIFFVPDTVGEIGISVCSFSGPEQTGRRGPHLYIGPHVPVRGQQLAPVFPETVVLRVLGELRPDLALDREALAEGESTTLSVTAVNLLPNEALGVDVSADLSSEVELSSVRLELTTQTSRQYVRVTAREDNVSPESRETVRIRAIGVSGPDVDPSETSLFILRHGFALKRLRISPSETPVNAAVTVEVELNAEAPAAVTGRVTLQRTLQGRRLEEVQTPIIEIAEGRTAASVQVRLTESGVYHGMPDGFSFVTGLESEREIADDLAVSGLTRVGLRVGLSVTPIAEQLQEGQDVELRIRATNMGEADLWSDEVLEVSALYDEEELELNSSLPLSLSGGHDANVLLRALALEDGEAESRETLILRLSGTSQYTAQPALADVHLVIPRHGYAVGTMTVTASPRNPSDAFNVKLILNAPAPSGSGASTLQATVQAFVRDTDRVAQTATVVIAPGETSGRTTINMREVSTYTLSIPMPEFMHGEPGDQMELEVDALDYAVSVHALLDYDGAASLQFTTPRQIGDFVDYFSTRPGLQAPAGPEFCTEEARTGMSVESRLPCLDVTADGFTDADDIDLIAAYMQRWSLIYLGFASRDSFLNGIERYENASSSEVERIIGNIQSLYPRTEQICRGFLLLCDLRPYPRPPYQRP